MKTLAFWLLFLLLFLSSPVFSQVTSSYVFSQAQFATGTDPVSIAVADFNGDGRLDLAVANVYNGTGGNTVSILLGEPDGTFAPKVDYPTGAGPYAVVAADFNGDGKLDLAVANTVDNTVSILIGNGDGTFQPHIDLPVGLNPRSLTAGDFNGDGKIDLAVANQGESTISILLGNGNGTFHVQGPYAINGLDPVSITAADFNGDGKLDLALAGSGGAVTLQGNGDGTFQTPVFQPAVAPGCLGGFISFVSVVAADFDGDGHADLAVAVTTGGYCGDNVSVFLGNGDGTFRGPANYACVRFVSSIIAADLNGDGKLDLVVGSSYGDPQSLSVLINKGDGTFQPHTDYAVGFAPIAVATGDFNGDGKLDLVTANDQDNNVAVLLGSGDGTFQHHSDYATGDASQGIVAADFNGDGHVDLATADCNSNTVSVLIGNGDGTFQPRLSFAAGQCPVALAAADFNGDGKIDLAVANQTDSTVSIFLGNGDGAFQARTDYALPFVSPYFAIAIAVGDFNRDSRPDVVILSSGGVFSILFGNGNGTFQPHVDYDAGTGIGASALTVGDFNLDGTPDLAITDSAYSGTMSVLLGNGDGSFRFASPPTYTLPFSPNSVAVGDFNRDGKLDLAVAQGTSQGAVSILLGFGDGGFQAPVQFQTNHYPGSVATADFDGDGILDLAVGGSSTSILLGNGDGTFQTHMDHGGAAYRLVTADFDGDGRPDLAATAATSLVSVFLNKPPAQRVSTPPSITSISPTSGTQGQTIPNFTVNGSNFDPAAVLSFGGTGIIVNSYSSRTSTQIVASITIASTATTGPYDVTATNPDSQHATLPSGFTVVAAPPPPTGTINVTTNAASATFSLTGPATLSGTGTSATFSNAPVGAYTITFGAVAGDITPAQQTQTLTAGGTITFTGTYNPAPPPPPPIITSISPLSGNRGQTIRVTVTGSSFLPGATLSFIGVAQTLTSQVTSVSIDGTSATASLVIPASAALELKDVIGANIGSSDSQPLLKAFRVDTETLVFSAPDKVAYEPSLAVDTLHPDHLVVGFNALTKGSNGAFTLGPDGCGWGESFNGGLTWRRFGSVHAPGKQIVRGDPWVHFGPDGTLFYSCTAVDDSVTSYVYLWSSPAGAGIASSLNDHPPVAIARVAANCSKLTSHKGGCNCTNDICTFLDEPSFSIVPLGSRVRLLACWVESRDSATPGTLAYSKLNIAVSNTYGATWPSPQTLAQPKAFSCRVDGNASQAVVTWLDNRPPSGNQVFADKLFFRSSTDPKLATWSGQSEVDPTLNPLTNPLLNDGSTTDKVYSRAFASVVSTSSAIRVVWQRRMGSANGMSQVLTRDLFPIASNPVPIGGSSFEKFLPTGGCGALRGAYQATASGPTSASAPFTYNVWLSGGSTDPIFMTAQQFDGSHGVDQRPEFPYPRIGEYTSVDCTSTTGWAAWTDLRDGKAEIWAARIPLQ